LRMHGAGVDRALSDSRARSTRHAGRGFSGRIQELGGVSQELGFTAAATEVIALALVLRTALGGSRIHDHSADGIMGLANCARTRSIIHNVGLLAAGPQQQAF